MHAGSLGYDMMNGLATRRRDGEGERLQTPSALQQPHQSIFALEPSSHSDASRTSVSGKEVCDFIVVII